MEVNRFEFLVYEPDPAVIMYPPSTATVYTSISKDIQMANTGGVSPVHSSID